MSEVFYKSVGGKLIPFDNADLAWRKAVQATQPAPLPYRTYKADIWRRATDAEATVIDAQINAQPLKLRNLFRDCDHLNHADPYFVQLRAGFVAAFGEERANVLLAPSV